VDGTTGDPKGTHKLRIPWERQADGTPVAGQISLRADASGYLTFPSGLRAALPVDVSAATKGASSWTLQSNQTDIGLIALQNAANLARIHGTVATPPNHEGVTGNLDFTGQNMPANPTTSVALVVKSTFIENLGRGEQPPGLSVSGVTSAATGYSIAGVPDGNYIVLAAFGNDGMVRDISGLGGCAPLEVDVSGGAVTVPPGQFKLTGAVTVSDPFVAPYDFSPWPANTGTPTFNWVRYNSAQNGYIVQVFDTFGNPLLPLIGAGTGIADPLTISGPTVTQTAGGTNPSYTYSGTPVLQNGMYYQFKVFAMQTISATTVVASQSKDQQGVFYVP
jgi:hypothetical protein